MSDERYKKEIVAFGKKLRELRLERNLIQLDFEASVGKARTEISKIENGQLNIEFFTIVRLAEVLNVEIRTLFEPLKENTNGKDKSTSEE